MCSVHLLHKTKKVWLPSPNDLADFSAFALAQLEVNGVIDAKDIMMPQLPLLLKSPSIAPIAVCSVVGAMLSQALLTAIAGKGEPMESILVFDGDTYEARSIEFKAE